MCKKLTFLVLLSLVWYANTQNKQLLFGFNDIPQSVLINPSTELNNKWFAGFPLVSSVNASFGASGVSAYDLFADDGRDFNSKLRAVVFNLQSNDFFTVNQQLDIFSGGFSFGKGIEKDKYFSFGMYLETDIIAYYPKDFAILAYEGNANNIGRVFDMSDLNVSGEMLSVFHVGVAKKVNDKLTIGARGKIYSSVFNLNSKQNKGSFITEVGQDNFFKHTFDLDLSLRTSGISSLTSDNNSDLSDDINTITKRVLFGGNLGLGLDVGFTYKSSDQLTFEASLLDFGFIRHSKDVQNYVIKDSYTFEGFNPLYPEVVGGQTAEDYWDDVADEF